MSSGPSSASSPPARLADVARAAGVSVATVSRVLSRPAMVAESTRAAVMEAVSRTGYRVNHAARNLRHGRTGAIVALVPNLGNPFFANILSGMGQEIAAAGYDLLVADTMDAGGRHRALARFLDPSRADGIILLDGRVTAADLAAMPAGPPLVTACEWVEGLDRPRIALDNAAGTALAVAHLRTLGHRRIGWIGGPRGNVLHHARLSGVAQVLGRVPAGYDGDFSLESGRLAALRWLSDPLASRPTGIVAFSDESAAGFMGELQRAGVSVPRDVSVVGFDGIDWVAHLPTPLTTVRQPKRDLGREAARSLLRLIGGERPADCLLAPQLILRSSTAEPIS